ncbi:GTP-binding protein [Candidatus Dependentiae bacterium]|nr:GTP-binding protein [Candidatus Dependentiae bacterium]
MENLNIVITGHVDHGKSTLIGRLFFDTGCFPKEKIDEIKATCDMQGRDFEYAYILDALEEERNQGITIDTTQTFFKTKKRQYTIIDAPGHIEFIKNMLTGATQAEAAILVIDAEEGVREQTRRHSYMLALIGIKQVIAVINKIDRVDYSEARYNELKTKLTEIFESLKFETYSFIPISAKKGDNIAIKSKNTDFYKGDILLDTLDNIKKVSMESSEILCFPIQDVYRIDDKRIHVGRIESGVMKKNQDIYFLPSKKKSNVTGVEVFMKNVESADKGECIGITIKDSYFIERGEVAANSPEILKISDQIKAKIIWLDRKPYKLGDKIMINCVTQEKKCVINIIENIVNTSDFTEKKSLDEITQYESATVKIDIKGELVFYDFNIMPELGRFVLSRDNNVVAGGIIL